MKFKDHLRIIWAITAKDICDAIKNKIVQGVLIGVGFMMLSSQALSLLIGFKEGSTAHFWDQGKSSIIKDIVRSRDLNFFPRNNLADLQSTVSQSVEPVLGIVIPADFDEQVAGGDPIYLHAYRAHWPKPDAISEVVDYFEENLSRATDTRISIEVDSEWLYPPGGGLGYPMMLALGMVLGVMTVGLILTPYLIVDEKDTKTLDALLISPARITHLLLGKSLAGLFYSLTASSLILVFSWRWIIHWYLILGAVLLGGLCAVSIGLLVGAFFENPSTVNMFSGLLIAGLLMPAYLWTSLASKMPPFLLSLIDVLPSITMYKIVRQSFIDITSFGVIWINSAILLAWSFIMIGLVGWRIRSLDR
jgi:ABC-2 type transport system permease protein